jgi:hypothetical protein
LTRDATGQFDSTSFIKTVFLRKADRVAVQYFFSRAAWVIVAAVAVTVRRFDQFLAVHTENLVRVNTVELADDDWQGLPTMTSVVISVLTTVRVVVRTRAALHLEILALRHQLRMCSSDRTGHGCGSRTPTGGSGRGCPRRGPSGARHSSSSSRRPSSPGIAKASACSGPGGVADT